MDDVEDSALHKILDHLSFRDRRSCRQVCKRWKTEIDIEIGLSVQIDDRSFKPGTDDLLTFFNQVTSLKVTITHLDSGWKDFKVKDSTKTLIFTGYLNPNFLKLEFLKNPCWKHFTKLYFHGRFLVSQRLLERRTGLYGGIDCEFPSLRELHFSLTRLDARYPLKAMDDNDNEFWSREVAAIISQNLNFLLFSMKCESLRVFGVHIDSPAPFPMEIIYPFIQTHGSTLEHVILRGVQEIEPRVRHCVVEPETLKSIYISNTNVLSGNSKFFWTELILSQNYLEEIFLTFNQFPVEIFTSLLMIIACRNFRSLKNLTLYADQDTEFKDVQEIDLDMFGECSQLEILVIFVKNSSFRPHNLDSNPKNSNFLLRNLNQLPESLKVLKSGFPTTDEFYGSAFLKEMENLEELVLPNIQPVGLMSMDRRAFLLTALRHRHLNIFNIGFGENELFDPAQALELPNSDLNQFGRNENGKPLQMTSVYIGGSEMSHGIRSEQGINQLAFRTYFDLLEHGTERNMEVLARQPLPCTYILDQNEPVKLAKPNVKPETRKLLRDPNSSRDSIRSSLSEYSKMYSDIGIGDVVCHLRGGETCFKKPEFDAEMNKVQVQG